MKTKKWKDAYMGKIYRNLSRSLRIKVRNFIDKIFFQR